MPASTVNTATTAMIIRSVRPSALTMRSVLVDDAVDQPVLLRFVGPEEVVALHVAVYLLDRAPRVVRVDVVDPVARLEDLAGVDLDVRRLALEAGRRLVDQDAAVGQREALAGRAARQQQRAHRHRDPAADRRHVR